jgi:hypothetical protein
MTPTPSPKLTASHPWFTLLKTCEDVKNNCAGVFGNAVWLIVGGEVTVVSTIDCNSSIVGKLQPDPSRASPPQ